MVARSMCGGVYRAGAQRKTPSLRSGLVEAERAVVALARRNATPVAPGLFLRHVRPGHDLAEPRPELLGDGPLAIRDLRLPDDLPLAVMLIDLRDRNDLGGGPCQEHLVRIQHILELHVLFEDLDAAVLRQRLHDELAGDALEHAGLG